MFKDDDEEEENTFGVTRYPCMPSLVALQQMRNRLHLAFLGRKLMKWTALATGREMRRLAQELYELYEGFGEDMRNAFILLARSRYFCPMLNHVVTENIGKQAGVVVQQSTRTVSAVKIVQFEIFETEVPPYPHLGLEKGGQCILEAKKAWLELLKRLIMMMQLRASFLMVELANKNATKKWNVLSKLVIPRVNLSCHYITSELEEIEREDNFRLKRFKELKIKKTKGKEDPTKASGKTCQCSANVKPKETISEANICNATYEEDILEEGQDEIESKLKDICSICKTDEEGIKPSLEENGDRILDKDLCNICKKLIDSEHTQLDRKTTKGICSKCEMEENNKTELNKTANSESLCPTCANERINIEKTIDSAKKDSELSKNILGEGECIYCKNKEQKDKPKIQVCKECQNANTNDIINDKRAINSDNLCPGCASGCFNDRKDIPKIEACHECQINKVKSDVKNNTCPACSDAMVGEKKTLSLNKDECLYCKSKKQITDTSKLGVCGNCQKTIAKSETNNITDDKESCPCKTKSIEFIDQRDIESPTESTLAIGNKTKIQNKCSSCKKAEFDNKQLSASDEKCLYCNKKENKVDRPKIEACQKCQLLNANDKKITNIDNMCPACSNRGMDTEKSDKLYKITLSKNECLSCRKKNETIDKSKSETCRKCQIKNSKSEEKNITDDKNSCQFCSKTKKIEFIDQRNIISPTGSTTSTESKTKEGMKLCASCKKADLNNAETVTNSALCQSCSKNKTKSDTKTEGLCSKNIIDDKNSCQFCSKTKKIEFIDQRNIISPTGSTSSTESKTKKGMKLCASCKKPDINKAETVTNSGLCQSCSKNKTKSDTKTEGLCSKNIIDDKNSCQFCSKTKKIEFIDQRNIISPTGSTSSTESKTKKGMKLCASCKKPDINKAETVTNSGLCQSCSKNKTKSDTKTECLCSKNIIDDKNSCQFCSKTKKIEFIDQRNIISPTGSTSSTESKTKEGMKLCASCKKPDLNKAETVTNSGLCQSCSKNKTKSDKKTDGLCSNCKNKNVKSNINEEKQKSKSCPTCQAPEIDNQSDSNKSAQSKTVQNNSNKCSACGKKSSKESVTTDTPLYSYKNDSVNKQDALNPCGNNDNSDAVGTFKEIVKIKRFSGTDGITHEHITVTSKKTQQRVLSEPACGGNKKNKSIRQTNSDNMDLNKRNGILKAGNINSEPSSDICLSCSSKKNSSGKSSTNKSSEIASIMSQSFSWTPPLNTTKFKNKETNSCPSCNNASSTETCKKAKSQDIRSCKSCTDSNSYSKVKIIIKDDKCKDNSEEEEIELTPSTIVILKKILSRTSKSTDSCKAFEKEDNKMTGSKCSCGAQQSSQKCKCKKKKCTCNSKANTSLKTKSVKSEPCVLKNTESMDKQSCGTCGKRSTKSKQSKNTCSKCQKDTPDTSKRSTPTGSCQECNKKENKEASNCNCNKTKNEPKCSCSKKQSVTIHKACSCNDRKAKPTSKSSSVESRYSGCCGEANSTSSIANQTCLMDRLSVGKRNSSTCTCNENEPAANKLKDECPCFKQKQPQAETGACSCQSVSNTSLSNKSRECSCKSMKVKTDGGCQCAKQNQPQPTTGSCSCQSVNKNASNSSSANKSGDCSCKSSIKEKKDACPCSKKNQLQPKTSTCSCKSGNKNAPSCMTTNKSQECTCNSTKEKDECQCSKLKQKKKSCSCSSVNKSNQEDQCSCKSLKNKIEDSESSCPCRKNNAKEQNICGKEESTGCNCNKPNIKADTEQCSCSQPGKSLKSNVKFENESQKPLCPCKSSESGQKSNSCSCKTENKSIKACGKDDKAPSTCPCQKSKPPLISPTHSNQSTTVAIQTCCLPEDKPEKCIKFSDKAAFTPNFKISVSSISPLSSKSSYVSLKTRSSQIKTSQCSCGRRQASTMTRRSDRYDVRTLRHLSIPPEPKTSACVCKSDSALLKNCKTKNVNPQALGRCQSLNNECCLRK